jgi:hypothetical protein
MGRLLLPIALALALAGCAAAPTYDSKVAAPLASAGQGNVDEALRTLDAKNQGSEKTDLLLNLERGELLRIDARYADSQVAFEMADVKVNQWEATAKSEPDKLMGQLGATLFGETFRTYEGQDYEKVMLTTRMAMNRISIGDLDNARVDVKRTHEREAVIAEFRAKELVAAEEEAKGKGITGEPKELNGYPIETLNDPEVLQLKNGYQNALSHYMAGFVYEALNEPSLAAPGYRHAIELRPGLPVLEEGLRGLDQRTGFRRPKGMTDVLFVIEAGNVPARKSQQITFPIPSRNGLIVVPLAFPVIQPNKSALIINQINVGDKSLPTALITDFNVMARRALKDELPGIQLRAAIRAIAKGVIQEQLNRRSLFLGLIGNATAAVTESPADDRIWRSLPERVFVARSLIAPGTYALQLPGLPNGEVRLTVEGRYMVVPVRILESRTYFAQPTHFGSAGQVANVEAAPKASGAKAQGKASAKPAQRPASTSGAGSTQPVGKSATAPKASPTTAESGGAGAISGAKAAAGAANNAAEPAKAPSPPNPKSIPTQSTSGSPPATGKAPAGSPKNVADGAKPAAVPSSTASTAGNKSDSTEPAKKPAPTPQ